MTLIKNNIKVILNIRLFAAIICSTIISLLEASGVIAISILLGTFVTSYELPTNLLSLPGFDTIVDIEKKSLQFYSCIALIIKYFLTIVLQVFIFILVYSVRFTISNKVLFSFISTAFNSKTQTQSHDMFLRNYTNGVEHVSDNLI